MDNRESIENGIRQLERVKYLMEIGRYAEAIPEIQSLMTEYPDDAEFRATLASAYLATGQATEALRYASEASVRGPDEEWPHRLRFWALTALGRHDEALTAAETALSCEPEAPMALYALTAGYLNVKKWADAERIAAQLLELDPDENASHEIAALVAIHQKRFADAEQSARRALEIDPESAQAQQYLGDALWGQKKWPEAYMAYRNASALSPGETKYLEKLANRVQERLMPSWLAFVVFLLATINFVIVWAALTCWTGSRWVAYFLSLFGYFMNTIKAQEEANYILYWRKKQYAEIPPEVQELLWRSNKYALNPLTFVGILGAAILVAIGVLFLTIGWPYNPGLFWNFGWQYFAFFYLGFRIIFSIRDIFADSSDKADALKPADMRKDAPKWTEQKEVKEAFDRFFNEKEGRPADAPAKTPTVPPLENPWAIKTRPDRRFEK